MSRDKANESAASSITRQQTADLLGVSVATVRRLEGTRLHPELDRGGVWRFDRVAVEEFARTGGARRRKSRQRRASSGEMAARVFRMLSDGKDIREIVVKCKQSPERVRVLYREWLTGLRQGEALRQRIEDNERQRRERIEDERLELEMISVMKA